MNILVWFAHLIVFLSAVPRWLWFQLRKGTLRQTQINLMQRLIAANQNTKYGREHYFKRKMALSAFRQLPLSGYDAYASYITDIRSGADSVLTRDPVRRLTPTSGSTGGSKYIPYTDALLSEFRHALDVWLVNNYVQYPALMFGKQYWALTPVTPPPNEGSQVPVGFAEDAEYFGTLKKLILKNILVVPPEITRVKSVPCFTYLTLLFLLREKNLRYLSIWSPSYWLALTQRLKGDFPDLLEDIRQGTLRSNLELDPALREKICKHLFPAPQRAQELERVCAGELKNLWRAWPKLSVISCWMDAHSGRAANELKNLFPEVRFEGKGLLATEAVVSIPFGRAGKKVLAYQSHFYEFVDVVSERLCFAWELQAGGSYRVIVTTGGGLYRYCLRDIIRVENFDGSLPAISFRGKEELISDYVGEKLDEVHVHSIRNRAEKNLGLAFSFFLLAPATQVKPYAYTLFIELEEETTGDKVQALHTLIENALDENYHYAHARNLGQLGPVRLFMVDSQTARSSYLTRALARGQRLGDIKWHALSPEDGWEDQFSGTLWNPT
jgi:hypothetical protein